MSALKYPYPRDIRGVLGVVFGCFGVLLLIISATGSVIQLNAIAGQTRTTGTVVAMRESPSKKSVVEFETAAGERITITASAISSPSYDIGEKVEVAYDPADPRDGTVIGFRLWLWQLIAGGVGLVSFAFGFSFVLYVRRRRRMIDRLIEQGRPITGTVREVVVDRTQRINSRHPFRVIVTVPNPISGDWMEVKSDAVWTDPRHSLPPTVTVWIDPTNPDHHLVDLSFLPR